MTDHTPSAANSKAAMAHLTSATSDDAHTITRARYAPTVKGLTNPQLALLAESVAERVERDPSPAWRELADQLARMCAFRGRSLGPLALRLERAATRTAREPSSV